MTPRAPVAYLQVILYSRSLSRGVNKPLRSKTLLTCPSMASFGLSLRPNNSWISMENICFRCSHEFGEVLYLKETIELYQPSLTP